MPGFDLSLIEFHKAAAHFPIGLLMSSFGFELLGSWRHKKAWQEAAYWNHIFGVFAAAVVVALGWFGNPYKNGPPELVSQIARHQYFGLASLIIFLILALWRIANRNRFTKKSWPVYLAAAFCGFIVIGITGWLGAHLG